jgi:hypothetical protein
MQPGRETTPLSADEHLKFQAIVDRNTVPDMRRSLSENLFRVTTPQGWFVCDAWQRAARKMWRTI